MSSSSKEVRFIYITLPTKTEAQSIGFRLVEDRLAACVNIFENMESIYWWGDELQMTGEVVMIAKTREELVEALTDTVKSMHSYACPCVVSMPIIGGNPAYHEWIIAETRNPESLAS